MLHVRERPRQPAPLERALAQYWRDHGASLPPLQCDDGSRLRVVYPGRASSAAGPDFRDAVLQRESGEVVRGDVELHLRRRGWEAHGHHTDSGYNGVVLHVVLHGGDTPITLASGRRVPTAALFPRTLGTRARREAPAPRPLPLAALPTAPSRLARTLDREGDARFFLKVRGFAQALRFPSGQALRQAQGERGSVDPSDALYRGLMGGLGYGGNSAPMMRLAEGLPLRALERSLRGVRREDRRAALASTLLGASGLSLSDAADGDAGSQGVTPVVARPVVAREEWKLFRVRPANHPSRRLEGMAALLDRAWDAGLAAWASALVAEGGVSGVRSALTVAPFDRLRANGRGGALIGADRASDLAVNVVLPFARAWGNLNRDGGLSAMAMALYRGWPPLQENAVTQEASRLLGVEGSEGKELRQTARRQQGLIRVYKRRLGGVAEG